MSGNKNIYKNSVSILKDNISRAIVITFFLSACYMLFYLIEKLLTSLFNLQDSPSGVGMGSPANALVISLFLFVFMFLILTPLDMGIRKWFYEICQNPKAEFSVIFDYFTDAKLYIRTVLLKLSIMIRLTFIYALFLLPILMIKILSDYPIKRLDATINTTYMFIFIMLVLAFIVGMICAIYFSLRYYLAYYVFFENSNSTVRNAIKVSANIMSCNKTQVIKLYFVLLPFYILCLFAVPLIFMVPYTYVLTSLKAKQLLQTNNS